MNSSPCCVYVESTYSWSLEKRLISSDSCACNDCKFSVQAPRILRTWVYETKPNRVRVSTQNEMGRRHGPVLSSAARDEGGMQLRGCG